jgi:CHAD domain-containing protein
VRDRAQAHEDVHALRIDGKLLRYTLELALPIGFHIPPTLFRVFKRLQDALGLWHDYVVLGEQCLRTAMDQQLSLHDPRLYGQVLALAQRCWRDSEMQLDRFCRLWNRSGASVQAEIMAALKPVGSQSPADNGSNGRSDESEVLQRQAVGLPGAS